MDMAERCVDIGVVANRIFTLGLPSSKIKELSTIEPTIGKPLNAKNLKKMKLIENIQKEPRATPIADISSRRVPLSDFSLFSEIESKPEVILRYLDACKADGTDPKLNIRDLHQPQPEVTLKKKIGRASCRERV